MVGIANRPRASGVREVYCVAHPGESGLTSRLHEVSLQGWRVRLDLREQVLSIDVSAHTWRDWREEDSLSPVVFDDTRFVSAAALLWKAKAFDDGLLAAIDLAAQHGAGRFPGR